MREILSPWQSPDEDYDRELLVIPFEHKYGKTSLSYGNLKGSDKLMADLLSQSNIQLEIRFASVVNYRAGTTVDGNRMNNDRADDFGCPNTPSELRSQSPFFLSSGSRRFAQVLTESCSIENPFVTLDGGEDNNKKPLPIRWDRDCIQTNIQHIEDLFEDSDVHREVFDCYNDIQDNLELQQWSYKSVMVVYPAVSSAIECRKDLEAVVEELWNNVFYKSFSREARRRELTLIVKHIRRTSDESMAISMWEIKRLISISNHLEMVEEAIWLFRFIGNGISYEHIQQEFQDSVILAGWAGDYQDIFIILNSGESVVYTTLILYSLIESLIEATSSSCRQAALDCYNYLYSTIFNCLPSEAIPRDLLVDKLCVLQNHVMALWSLLCAATLVSHHQLMKEDGQLIDSITSQISLNNLGIIESDVVSRFNGFYPLSQSLSFNQLPFELKNFFESLSKRFLSSLNGEMKIIQLSNWIMLFMYIDCHVLFQQLMEKINSSLPGPQEETRKMLLDTLLHLSNSIDSNQLKCYPAKRVVKTNLDKFASILVKYRLSLLIHFLFS